VDIIHSILKMKEWSQSAHKKKRTIGFIPTMGALHEGHLSLVAKARAVTDATVMSIFVNPAQFGPTEDYKRYPRPLEADCAKAANTGCDAVFAPDTSEMYPEHYHTFVTVEELNTKLCGTSRPDHFRGVTTVVLKLFNIVTPDTAFFGQKDAQQVIILRRMVEDLNIPIRIEVCPTVRESDGLAMSSRNAYLTPAERAAAPLIYKGLLYAHAQYEAGGRDAARLIAAVGTVFRTAPLIKKEYIEIVDMQTLNPLTTISSAALMAVACRTVESGARLIDNMVLGGSL
jgi:pantoate--beta-alanine ligase